MKRHLIIPDVQIKPGSKTEHLKWAAEAILDYRPDVVVCFGDFWIYLVLTATPRRVAPS